MIKDIIRGEPIITIVGNNSVHIENYRNILEINDCKVRIMSKKGPITVLGQNLSIEYYNEDDLIIDGYILNIEL